MASQSWIEPYPCLPPQTQDALGSNCFLKGQISRFPCVAPYHFLSLIICCRHIKIGTLSIDMLSMVSTMSLTLFMIHMVIELLNGIPPF